MSAIEHCRHWPADRTSRCGRPAIVIVWGKLADPEQLGPRCERHTPKWLDLGRIDPYAVFDLRGLERVDGRLLAGDGVSVMVAGHTVVCPVCDAMLCTDPQCGRCLAHDEDAADGRIHTASGSAAASTAVSSPKRCMCGHDRNDHDATGACQLAPQFCGCLGFVDETA